MTAVDDAEDMLSAEDRQRFRELAAAESLADLVALTAADSEHDAYYAAKREWKRLQRARLANRPSSSGLPGVTVTVDGHRFHVHGITHSGTDTEREYLREHVRGFRDDGSFVYCEQGIRGMFFQDMGGVCEMDDYRWALERCAQLDEDSRLVDLAGNTFDGVGENVVRFAGRFQEATFSLIEAGSDVYGEEYARALGDVASNFVTSHEDHATGDDFESFRLTRRAAEDPAHLRELQDYYAATFLPQPVEREWLARHDEELEIVTHARNERMADYAVYHNEDVEEVRIIVGAAHQPGVAYYLREHATGERSLDGFTPL